MHTQAVSQAVPARSHRCPAPGIKGSHRLLRRVRRSCAARSYMACCTSCEPALPAGRCRTIGPTAKRFSLLSAPGASRACGSRLWPRDAHTSAGSRAEEPVEHNRPGVRQRRRLGRRKITIGPQTGSPGEPRGFLLAALMLAASVADRGSAFQPLRDLAGLCCGPLVPHPTASRFSTTTPAMERRAYRLAGWSVFRHLARSEAPRRAPVSSPGV